MKIVLTLEEYKKLLETPPEVERVYNKSTGKFVYIKVEPED